MTQMKTLAIKGKCYEIVDESARDAIDRNCASVIVQTKEGPYVTASDCSEKKLQGLRLFGKTTQSTTKGVQLLPLTEDNTVTDRGITQVVAGGICKVTGTATADSGFNLTLLGAYTNTETCFTLDPGTYTVTDCVIFNYDGTTRTSYQDTFTLTEAFDVTWVSTRTYTVGETVSETTYPMLNAGSTALDWEPYTGGKLAPNSDYPQSLVAIDELTIGICSNNLLDQTLAFTATGDTTEITKTITENGINLTGTPTRNYVQITTGHLTMPSYWRGRSLKFGASISGNEPHVVIYFRDEAKSIITQVGLSASGENTVFVPPEAAYYEFAFCLNRITTGSAFTAKYSNMYLSVADATTTYETYVTPQTFLSARTLRGIPVESGGNYTDSNGQQWVCDEVDLERGVYIQRIGETVFDENQVYHLNEYRLSSEGKYVFGCSHSGLAVSDAPVMSDRFNHVRWDRWNLTTATQDIVCYTGVAFFFFLLDQSIQTVDAFTEYMASHPTTVQYILNTPIVTPISEYLTIYKKLHTNYPNTTILNDSGAWMNVKYAADLGIYIRNTVKELFSE